MKKITKIWTAFNNADVSLKLKLDFISKRGISTYVKDRYDRKQQSLTFRSILTKVSRKDRLILLSRGPDTNSLSSFFISCSNDTYFNILRSDVFLDWRGSVGTERKCLGDEIFLSFNGPDICYHSNSLHTDHPLRKLKDALVEYSIPYMLDKQLVNPGRYVPVLSRGDFRCATFPGGKAFQWILESKSGKIRSHEEFSEIKYTKSLSKRFFLDSRAAVRAPAFLCSDDARTWIFIDFPREGSDQSIVNTLESQVISSPQRHLNDGYLTLWKQLALFFRLAYAQQALRTHNPCVGEITQRNLKAIYPDLLDADPLCLKCAVVSHPGSNEAVLIVGPRGSGKRTLAHHLLSCCPAAQLVTTSLAVCSLQFNASDQGKLQMAVSVDGCPVFHSVRVGTAIGSLFPNPFLEQIISSEFAQKYLLGVSEKALWGIMREIPVCITKCYGSPRRIASGPQAITSIIIMNWSAASSRLTNDPSLSTLLRTDPPVKVKFAALEACLFNNGALATHRFVTARNTEFVSNSLALQQSAIAQVLVGENLRYRSMQESECTFQDSTTRDCGSKKIRWYEVTGEVNFQRITKYVVEKIFKTNFVHPPGVK